MVSISRVYSKQQDIFINETVFVYSKLWYKVKNEGRYKNKRKSGKSNGVCKADKESAERDRGSIKKSIERDKVIGR